MSPKPSPHRGLDSALAVAKEIGSETRTAASATEIVGVQGEGKGEGEGHLRNKDANVLEKAVPVTPGKESRTSRGRSLWAIFGSALANFSDGYQNNLASSTNVVFKHLYPTEYTSSVQTRISNALLVGAVIGIVILGFLSDVWSRKGGLWLTSGLVVVGSLMATLAFQVQGHGVHDMLWYLTIARGIAGVGVGGEYPPSAAAALEGSNDHFDSHRGPIQVAISTLMATSAAPICTFVYLASLLGSSDNLKIAYHAMYGISIFIPLGVVLIRLKMRDASLFRRSNFKRKLRIPYALIFRRYGLTLVGTSSAFFLYDFINFPNSIMSSAIINGLVPSHNVRTVAVWQLILAALPVPGVLLGVWLCNRIGRRWTGMAGFLGYAVLGFILGGCYSRLTHPSNLPGFVVLYGLLQGLGHMGPGATIGLMSVESYPTAVRATGYGISAAFGKAGAAVGTQVFTPIQDAAGPAATFYVAGAVGVVGTVIYWFLPEGRDVDLAVEDEAFEEYLREMGWKGVMPVGEE